MKKLLTIFTLISLFSCNNKNQTTTAQSATKKDSVNIKDSTPTIETKADIEVPDFTAPDVDGKPVTLSNFYKGKKLVLIDFWASWCKPCRIENPNVVAAYNKFSKKGFDIISVSLDETKNSWLEAIKKDKLTWTNVSELKWWDGEIGKLYQIQSIPTNYLIDGNGKLLATDLRGQMLEAKLEELLSIK